MSSSGPRLRAESPSAPENSTRKRSSTSDSFNQNVVRIDSVLPRTILIPEILLSLKTDALIQKRNGVSWSLDTCVLSLDLDPGLLRQFVSTRTGLSLSQSTIPIAIVIQINTIAAALRSGGSMDPFLSLSQPRVRETLSWRAHQKGLAIQQRFYQENRSNVMRDVARGLAGGVARLTAVWRAALLAAGHGRVHHTVSGLAARARHQMSLVTGFCPINRVRCRDEREKREREKIYWRREREKRRDCIQPRILRRSSLNSGFSGCVCSLNDARTTRVLHRCM